MQQFKAIKNVSKVYQSAEEISDWMDNPSSTLIDCYNEKIADYSKDDLLNELENVAKQIREKDFSWDEKSFSRCFKGLKDMPAIPAVRSVLASITVQIEKNNRMFSPEIIMTARASLGNMKIFSNEYQRLMRALFKTQPNLYGLQPCPPSSPTMVNLYRALSAKRLFTNTDSPNLKTKEQKRSVGQNKESKLTSSSIFSVAKKSTPKSPESKLPESKSRVFAKMF